MTHFSIVKPGYYPTYREAVDQANATPCRCCNQPMHADAQVFLNRGFYGLVTCTNTDCPLDGYTFSTTTYADKDLSAYAPCFAPPTKQEL